MATPLYLVKKYTIAYDQTGQTGCIVFIDSLGSLASGIPVLSVE